MWEYRETQTEDVQSKVKDEDLALERTLQVTCEEMECCKELLEQREAVGSSPGATDVAKQLKRENVLRGASRSSREGFWY